MRLKTGLITYLLEFTLDTAEILHAGSMPKLKRSLNSSKINRGGQAFHDAKIATV
jgi:hypothetical protein